MPQEIPSEKVVTVIGGGLAGCEAAWQVASNGFPVRLFEMRPETTTKAHKTGDLAELVCSNSLRGAALSNAVGLLKEELRLAKSLIMRAADASAVPAGGALAVDRSAFSAFIESEISNHPLIEIHREEVTSIPAYSASTPLVIASGPLTSPALFKSIMALTGSEQLSFFDAISPIVTVGSLDMNMIFRQSRYDKGDGDDYLNIPLDEQQYNEFADNVIAGEKFSGHEEVESDSIENLRPFEGCMPIEDMLARGRDTLLFGPMKPVGLTDPRTGRRPYAVIQLRQDDKEGQLWSMVGFQTRLKQPEQRRIFSSLPGMAEAEFVRLGSVHRNSFINSPNLLSAALEHRDKKGLFFAGQITGVEGYVESTAAGLVAGWNIARQLSGHEMLPFPANTAVGSLINYVSDPERKDFQPMNISFGLMKCYLDLPMRDEKGRKTSKNEKREHISRQALELLGDFFANASP